MTGDPAPKESDVHPDLTAAFVKVVETLKADSRCFGGWHYGSVGRGDGDEWSDYDPVYLVPDAHFEAFARDVPRVVAAACDELLVCWAEDYNSDHFKNFCNLIRLGDSLHQLDFFILNADRTGEWWCRQHLKGCTRENIIFDRAGAVGELLDRGLRTDNPAPNPARCFDTYWFHAEMLVKYFKREDLFKILKNVDFLLHAHADLLLTAHDCLDWGAWETKVKKCVPKDRQEHLLRYFAAPDLESYKATLRRAMPAFDADAREIFASKGLAYPGRVATLVMEYFNREVT